MANFLHWDYVTYCFYGLFAFSIVLLGLQKVLKTENNLVLPQNRLKVLRLRPVYLEFMFLYRDRLIKMKEGLRLFMKI